MLLRDFANLALSSVVALRFRSFLTALGISIGIASVVLLTSIGAGINKFMVSEFTQFGTNLISIVPGKTTTMGVSGAVIGNVRPLSIDDSLALKRLPQVKAVVPVVQGNASVKSGKMSRRTTIFGVGAELPELWQASVTLGKFLPDDDPRTARAFAVLGSTIHKELFAGKSPLGALVRIGGERYRVVGVMEPKGQLLGFDIDDAVYIPAIKAMGMFDRQSLMEIDILYRANANVTQLVSKIEMLLEKRHGDSDVTITTQEQMMDVLGDILNIMTLGVAALGSISLFVGGVGIVTIMSIAVQERTDEVGLLRALGARRHQILALFISEAIVLSAIGGLAGLLIGAGGALLLGIALPALPIKLAWFYIVLAELLALFIGLVAGVAPALRASKLSPVDALRSE